MGHRRQIVVGALALGTWLAAQAAEPSTAVRDVFEQAGVKVISQLIPLDTNGDEDPAAALNAGSRARLRVTFSETATGSALRGVRPLGWFTHRRDGVSGPDTNRCVEQIRRYSSGGMDSLADVDLNQYFIYSLNGDRSITVLNPLVSFSRTKLFTIMTLDADPGDWVQMPLRSEIYVSLPALGTIVRIDTRIHKVIGQIAVGGRPTRLYADQLGGRLWVADEASGAALEVDPATGKTLRRVALGGTGLVFSGGVGSERLVITSSQGLAVLGGPARAVSSQVRLSRAPQSSAVSDLAGAAFLAFEAEGVVAVIDLESGAERARIALKPGLRGIAASPDGRWVLVPNALEKTVTVIDATSAKVTRTIAVDSGPDKVTFTDHFAYVRCIDSTKIDMIPLTQLGEAGEVGVIAIPVGQYALGEEVAKFAGETIQPTPAGDAVIVGAYNDRNLYFYQEGMMAPMGSYQNSSRPPIAVQIVSSALRETLPGVFEAEITPADGGNFDLALAVDSPRMTHCVSFAVKENPALVIAAAAHLSVSFSPLATPPRVGATTPLRFRLQYPSAPSKAVAGLKDVDVLVFQPPGLNQFRLDAREIAEGEYEVLISFPDPGEFLVFPRSLSQGLDYGDLPATRLNVASPEVLPTTLEDR